MNFLWSPLTIFFVLSILSVMPRVKKTAICESDDDFPELSAVNLRWIFARTNDELLRFLAYNTLLKNERNCTICDKPMSIIKELGTGDGVFWRCSECKGKKSVRADSFFEGSKLPLVNAVPLLYMWV
jgi:hypothetical protein